jgi:hypothetical protein
VYFSLTFAQEGFHQILLLWVEKSEKHREDTTLSQGKEQSQNKQGM